MKIFLCNTQKKKLGTLNCSSHIIPCERYSIFKDRLFCEAWSTWFRCLVCFYVFSFQSLILGATLDFLQKVGRMWSGKCWQGDLETSMYPVPGNYFRQMRWYPLYVIILAVVLAVQLHVKISCMNSMDQKNNVQGPMCRWQKKLYISHV